MVTYREPDPEENEQTIGQFFREILSVLTFGYENLEREITSRVDPSDLFQIISSRADREEQRWRQYINDPDSVAVRIIRDLYEQQTENVRSLVRVQTQQPYPSVTQASVAEYLESARNRMVNVGQLTWEHTRNVLIEGVREGEGIAPLRDRVRESVGFTDRRAEVVARTEVQGAASAATFMQASVISPNATKTWLATSDDRTRPSHAHVNGQERQMFEPFTVGGFAMQRPLDPFGPVREVIQCRCTLTYEMPVEDLRTQPVAIPGIDDLAASGVILSSSTGSTGRNGMPLNYNEVTDDMIESASTQFQAWHAPVLVRENETTGDHRRFEIDALVWSELPLSLMLQLPSHGGIEGESRLVGRIDEIWRGEDPTIISARGVFDDSEDGREAARLVGEGMLRGVSVDVDDIEISQETLEKESEEIDRIIEGGEMSDEPIITVFSHGRIRGATLTPLPAFVDAHVVLVDAERSPDGSTNSESRDMPLVAGASRQLPHEWFTNPHLSELTPITVTDDGRVYGHTAPNDTCHIGFADQCIEPPYEEIHDYFLTGEIETTSGKRVAVGQITVDGDHAPLSQNAFAAKQHYENTTAPVADVACGNDRFGVWVTGAIRENASEHQVNALRAAGNVSPDWRRIGTALRMVAMLAVNASGFPVPRARVASGAPTALVADGRPRMSMDAESETHSHGALVSRLLRIAGEDHASHRARLNRRLSGRD